MTDLYAELEGYSGTEGYTNGWLGVLMTDGTTYLMTQHSWLVTDICSIVKAHPEVKKEEFISIKVKVLNKQAKVSYGDGNGTVFYTQEYVFTDFPEGKLQLFYTDGVLMLSSEY